jgi:hypothetical protein
MLGVRRSLCQIFQLEDGIPVRFVRGFLSVKVARPTTRRSGLEVQQKTLSNALKASAAGAYATGSDAQGQAADPNRFRLAAP